MEKELQKQNQAGTDAPGRAHGFSLPGTVTFITLRSLDFFLQLYLLRRYSSPITSTDGTSSLFNLPPYQTFIALMVLTTSLRHIFWITYLSAQRIDPSFALVVSVFNTAMNSLSILMALWPRMSNAPSADADLWTSPTRILGISLFILGSLVETCAEIQRKGFKKRSENKGKVYMGGLFALARHVNFGGYLLWRSGLALFAGGALWGGVIASYFLWYFLNMGIPALDEYCSKRVCRPCPFST
jgi:hypothetical protein